MRCAMLAITASSPGLTSVIDHVAQADKPTKDDEAHIVSSSKMQLESPTADWD